MLIVLYTIMSSNTRVTRSKGQSDGLSLPSRTRQTRKSTNMVNNENTELNTTFDTGLEQHHPQMPVHEHSHQGLLHHNLPPDP